MEMDTRGFKDFDWTLSLSHHGAYLNIDDILATNERLPCRLKSKVPKVANLLIASHQGSRGRSSEQDKADEFDCDIPAGTRLELPIWLALSIGSTRRQLLAIDLPIIYRESYREVFAADSWVVDLKKKAAHFYSLGCHLSNLSSSELPTVLATVESAFQRRFKMLMEAALNANRRDVLFLTSRLDELEMALFRIGQRERAHLERWSLRHHERMEASTVARETLELISIEEDSVAKRSRAALTEQNW